MTTTGRFSSPSSEAKETNNDGGFSGLLLSGFASFHLEF
jgi:hypothetical protein